jgi:hypothetical protein
MLKLTPGRLTQIAASLFQGYIELFPPGEILDRLSILEIKHEKGLISRLQVSWGSEMYLALMSLLSREDVKKYERCYIHLKSLNLAQWNFEDLVRKDRSGEAAFRARKNNDLRVRVKNEVNKLFKIKPEVKKYK